MTINLVHKETKKVLKVGDKVSDFRGDQGVITHMSPPKHSGSRGKVVLKYKDLMEWDDWGDAAESNFMGENRIPVDRSELADFQNGGFLLEDQGYTINGPAAKFSFKDNLSENEYEVVVQKKRGFNEKS